MTILRIAVGYSPYSENRIYKQLGEENAVAWPTLSLIDQLLVYP